MGVKKKEHVITHRSILVCQVSWPKHQRILSIIPLAGNFAGKAIKSCQHHLPSHEHHWASDSFSFTSTSLHHIFGPFKRKTQHNSPIVYKRRTVSCYNWREFCLIVFVFCIIPNLVFSGKVLPSWPWAKCFCVSLLHDFRLISEHGPLQCRKLHYSPCRKTVERRLCSRLSLLLLLQKGNLIFYP